MAASSKMSQSGVGRARAIGTRVGVAGLAACVSSALLVAAALGPSVSGASRPVAVPARTIVLNESGRLHLTSKHGFTLNEEGSATGTIRGRIYLHLKIVSTNRVTAEVNIYPSSGGSLTGYATARYGVAGGTATFSGSMSIARGSGRYRSAHGSGLGFKGTIGRSTDAVIVYLTGQMSV
jgi:hypothetical protein